MNEPCVENLIELFNRLFKAPFNTTLVKGDDEPVYLPADQDYPHHRVIFAHGFYASALHEIAHWCVAGEKRRQLVDFGYWYKPDGRTAEEQAEFEQVEVRPQAFEWLLSQASGHKFHFSADNLSADIGASETFRKSVQAEVFTLLEQGFPERLGLLIGAMCQQQARAELTKQEFLL